MNGTKTFRPVAIKAGPSDGLAEGQVTALVSVYDVRDSDGDIIAAGEFDAWAEKMKTDGETMPPVVFHHKHDDPQAYIGDVTDINTKGEATLQDGTEVKGLEVTMQFDMDEPYARKAYDNVARGRMKEWSHAWRAEKRERTKAGSLLKGVSLLEVSPVLSGANRLTRTLAVKSDKAGHKAYVDVEVPGSYEAVQDTLREALQDSYGSPAETIGGPYVNLVATMPDRCCYQVNDDPDAEAGDDDPLYWVDYSIAADGSVAFGEPTPASATISDGAAGPAKAASMDAELLKLGAEAVAS